MIFKFELFCLRLHYFSESFVIEIDQEADDTREEFTECNQSGGWWKLNTLMTFLQFFIKYIYQFNFIKETNNPDCLIESDHGITNH